MLGCGRFLPAHADDVLVIDGYLAPLLDSEVTFECRAELPCSFRE